jgi:hypothetical protein
MSSKGPDACAALPNQPSGVCYYESEERERGELRTYRVGIPRSLSDNPKELADFVASEAEWDKYLASACRLDARLYFSDGSGYSTELAHCHSVLIRRHIDTLRDIYNWPIYGRQ